MNESEKLLWIIDESQEMSLKYRQELLETT
jgi:hypothetical protein